MKAMMHVKIPVNFFKEGDVFIAYSPVLDLSTSAKTFETAQRRFGETVQIFFEELIKLGTLDEVLASLGWQKVKSRWSPPIPVYHELTNITVPLKN